MVISELHSGQNRLFVAGQGTRALDMLFENSQAAGKIKISKRLDLITIRLNHPHIGDFSSSCSSILTKKKKIFVLVLYLILLLSFSNNSFHIQLDLSLIACNI